MAANVINMVPGCMFALPEQFLPKKAKITPAKDPVHISFGDVHLFFSLTRLIAFKIANNPLVVRINDFDGRTDLHITKILRYFSEEAVKEAKQHMSLYEFKELWLQHWTNYLANQDMFDLMKKEVLAEKENWTKTKHERAVRRNTRAIRQKKG